MITSFYDSSIDSVYMIKVRSSKTNKNVFTYLLVVYAYTIPSNKDGIIAGPDFNYFLNRQSLVFTNKYRFERRNTRKPKNCRFTLYFENVTEQFLDKNKEIDKKVLEAWKRSHESQESDYDRSFLSGEFLYGKNR